MVRPLGSVTILPTVTGAAFFDLDRTLLRRASGEAFSNAMRAAGMAPRRVPGEGLLYRLFNTIGENVPAMMLARQAVVWAKGKPRQSVVDVARVAADELFELVQPFAHLVIADHHQHGRPVVLATTSPYDMVSPFAEKLGLDDVIATRYGVDDDGTYDGTLDGHFVWSAGKLAAVEEWAAANGIDLAESYAYSDSVYDTPLLAAVGYPMVVNPDPPMVVMAAARRWPVMSLDVPKGVRKLPFTSIELQRWRWRSPGPSCSRMPASTSKASTRSRRRAPASSSPTTAATSTSLRSRSPSPARGARCGRSARRRCSRRR
ncbi:MAG: HAD family hydrolase [Ilumatobacteraceae bacterium]